MYQYLIVSDNLQDADVKAVTSDMYSVSKNVWIVSCSQSTCGELSRALGMESGTDAPIRTGVVVKVSEYHGLFNTALWQKLYEWRTHIYE